ncbi:hypothetical protein [Microbulbifer sp. SAOS-129_SWC]|uniref:hypothetical protein n=1 Tax=Microbulbifer sp. SAOS-129_SWC TaxID=3145235 RepID=UPI0032162DD0
MTKRKESVTFSEFLVAFHRPSIAWWPFPFLRPEEGEPFGQFRLFTCALLYPLFVWCLVSLLLFLKQGVGADALVSLFPPLFVLFGGYFCVLAHCWKRVHGS